MHNAIDIDRLRWDSRNGRFPPDDSDVEKERDAPVPVHRMRRKSFYVRFPGECGPFYTAPSLVM